MKSLTVWLAVAMLTVVVFCPAQAAASVHKVGNRRLAGRKAAGATHGPGNRSLEIVYPAELGPDLVAAETYWNIAYPPLCETAEIILAFPATPDTAGEATLAQAPGEECSMDIRPNLVEPQLCPAIVHEYGHWLGLEHTQNPADVMYEGGPWWATIPPCEALALRQ